MSYYLWMLVFFLLAFCIGKILRRLKNQDVVIVRVRHKDGSTTDYLINRGRDPEVDELIRLAKSKKQEVV